MKKTLIVLSVCIFSFSLLHAQGDSTKHKITLGLEVNTLGNNAAYNSIYYPYYYYGYYGVYYTYPNPTNSQVTNKSFSFGVKANYYLNNNLSVKFKLGMRSNNIYEAAQDTGGNPTNTTVTSVQRDFYLAIGCQNDIHVTKFTTLYVGMDFTFNYYGTFTNNQTEAYNSYIFIPYNYVYKLTAPGGVTVGIGPVIGFNFTVCKHVGFGAEVTQAIVYQSLGGTETETDANNFSSYSKSYNYNNKTSGWANYGTIISINLNFLF